MTQCSQHFSDAMFTDLNKQGFAKQGGDESLRGVPDEWLVAFYNDARQWLAESGTAGPQAAVERYKAEKHRRGL